MGAVLVVCLWASAAWLTLGVFGVITSVGKERKPITGVGAAVTVAVSAILIGSMVAAAIQVAGL